VNKEEGPVILQAATMHARASLFTTLLLQSLSEHIKSPKQRDHAIDRNGCDYKATCALARVRMQKQVQVHETTPAWTHCVRGMWVLMHACRRMCKCVYVCMCACMHACARTRCVQRAATHSKLAKSSRRISSKGAGSPRFLQSSSMAAFNASPLDLLRHASTTACTAKHQLKLARIAFAAAHHSIASPHA